ncbi:MAG: SBBP repeat-containing protein [Planctomycetaceae bacterium]
MPFNVRSILKSLHSNKKSRRRVVESASAVEKMEARELLSAANFGFVSSFEGGALQEASAAATDSDGNVYTVGNFVGTTDFDPGAGELPLTSQGATATTDGFISKLDANGAFVAAGQFASDSDVEVTGIATDVDGNLYITGQYSDVTDFDPTAGVSFLNGTDGDAFVVKLDSSLNLQWAKRLAGNGSIVANGIAVDGDGDAYVAGWFSKTIDFLPGPGTKKKTAVGKRDAYVVRFDTDGNSKYVSRFEGDGSNRSQITDIDADGPGNVFVTGWFGGDTDFDPKSGETILSSAGGRDAFVSRLDRSGALMWVRQLGGVDGDEGRAIAIDQSTRDVYVGSSHVGTVDFDPSPAFDDRSTNSDDRTTGHENFITRYDLSGTRVWTNQFSENAGDLAVADLAVDVEGDFYVTGAMSGIMDFDTNTNVADFEATSGQDVFAAKYDADGNFIWAGLGDPEHANGIAVADGGAVYVVGDGSGGNFADTVVGPGAFVWQTIQVLTYEVPADVTDVVIRRSGDLFEIYDANAAVVLESGDISTTAGIRVDGSNTGSLDVTVDYDHGGSFTMPLGIELEGSSGGNDVVTIVGDASLNGVYLAESSEVEIDGASDVLFKEFEQFNMHAFDKATLRTGDGEDNVRVTADADLAGGEHSATMSGKVNSTDFVPFRVYDVSEINVRTLGGSDRVRFEQDSLDTRGLVDLFVFGGGGDDTMLVDGGRLTLDTSGGLINFDGGVDDDTLAVEGDVDFEMDNSRLASTGGGAIFFTELETGRLTGGDSANRITARNFQGNVIIDGKAGNDTLIGAQGADTIIGAAGDDAINGREGHDVIRGGSGDDTIRGHDGNDRIGGGNDNDIIYGQKGSDTLMGGDGADELDGGADNDALHGEGGADMFMVDADDAANQLLVRVIASSVVSIEQMEPGDNVVTERDTIEQDAEDEVFVNLFDGDDIISVADNVTLDGTVDGGTGSDTCSAPTRWNSVNC